MKTLGSLICLLSLVCTNGLAGSARGWSVDGRSQAQLLRKSYDSVTTGKERDYFLYLPAGYFTEPGRTWPVILFLHGGLLSGNGKEDLDRVLNVGPLYEAWIQTRDLPFVILYPQLAQLDQPAQTVVVSRRSENGPPPPRKYGPRPEQPMARESSGTSPQWGEKGPPGGWGKMEGDLLHIVDTTLENYRTDPDRVYLTGLSYGGYGTWHMAMAHPERWAAAAPLCGAGDPERVRHLAESQLPLWVFQGGRDTLVRPEWVLQTVKALEAAGHPHVRFTVHEDLAHNVWTRVYEGWDLYNWFLSHRRKN